MPNHQLAEVFGFPITNLSKKAERYRKNKLCPYNNKVPSCTKDKANAPLAVCSIFEGDEVAITCPIRFREEWQIIEDAADFIFPKGTSWTSLQEIRLNDFDGQSAGNIDFVLVSYDKKGQITDFGSLEVQGVYITGNVRKPFEFYMKSRRKNKDMNWTETRVRADYLSSSRKRLVPQLIYKGTIFKGWRKKQTVALHEAFFKTLPKLPTVKKSEADIAWLVYGMKYNKSSNCYHLILKDKVYTPFKKSLNKIITPSPGPVGGFLNLLQNKLNEKFKDDKNPPDAPTLTEILSS